MLPISENTRVFAETKELPENLSDAENSIWCKPENVHGLEILLYRLT